MLPTIDFVAIEFVVDPRLERGAIDFAGGENGRAFESDHEEAEWRGVVFRRGNVIAEFDEDVVGIFARVGDFVEHIVDGNRRGIVVAVSRARDRCIGAIFVNDTARDGLLVCQYAVFEDVIFGVSEIDVSRARFPSICREHVFERRFFVVEMP